MDSLLIALAIALIGGITIPLGALVSKVTNIRPRWLEAELRHSITAFGGGVLLAAVSLVLVPEGIAFVSTGWVIYSFSLGGLVFFLADRLIAKSGDSTGQLMAMLLDYIPEATALGAALAVGDSTGLLLALLIALQNFPEGFNAFREIENRGHISSRKLLGIFFLLPIIGPLFAFIGHEFLAGHSSAIGAIMLFASGGIIYLTFEDIAPQVVLENHWAPPLGAVLGFLLGLIGHLLIN